MPIDITQDYHADRSVNVQPLPGHYIPGAQPKVRIGFGALSALVDPHEARELAHALVEAADEATRKQPEEKVA